MFGNSDKKLMDQIFNLKFTSKQMVRASKKCEAEEKAERTKIKNAIEKRNEEGAKIYCQNAIRKKNEALNYLRLGSRLDAVVARLETQAKMQGVNRSMASIVKSLDRALRDNNMDRVASTMDTFEKQFESLDVQSDFVENAMSAQTALSTPESEVKALLQQVADAHNLELASELPSTQVGAAAQKAGEKEDLATRLAGLGDRT